MLRTTLLVLLAGASPLMAQTPDARPRAREAGVIVGVFQPGANNAITDVAGVLVGHATVVRGDSIHTGVTAIRPHGGNVFADRVPAAIVVGNGFGKLLGISQVRELGELETPILLTCTLCVWRAADAMVSWLLRQPDMQSVRSINPVGHAWYVEVDTAIEGELPGGMAPGTYDLEGRSLVLLRQDTATA
jgi:D-aminopeptidase